MNKNQHARNLFKTMNEGNFTILGVIILWSEIFDYIHFISNITKLPEYRNI